MLLDRAQPGLRCRWRWRRGGDARRQRLARQARVRRGRDRGRATAAGMPISATSAARLRRRGPAPVGATCAALPRGRGDQPPGDLRPGRLRLGCADPASAEIALEFAELVAVDALRLRRRARARQACGRAAPGRQDRRRRSGARWKSRAASRPKSCCGTDLIAPDPGGNAAHRAPSAQLRVCRPAAGAIRRSATPRPAAGRPCRGRRAAARRSRRCGVYSRQSRRFTW